MSYRENLPQLGDKRFLTDGGMETTLIFHDGLDLPHFAVFPLVETDDGLARLVDYFERYIDMARKAGLGFVLEAPTWRANPDWAEKLGYDREALDRANRRMIALMAELREKHQTAEMPMVISGCIGPRGDGYDPGTLMTADESEAYHGAQIATFAKTEADMVSAFTMTNTAEAIGIVRAAQKAGLPVVISFTVETDGALPTGEPIGEAIETVDRATGNGPAYYMINCAHPTHYADALDTGASWTKRLKGLRSNASRLSHAELDEAEELDIGDPQEFGKLNAQIAARFPHIRVLGGCCGTDHRHVDHVNQAWRRVA